MFLAQIFLCLALCATASARVLFVDNSRPEMGDGSPDHPFKTLSAAESHSRPGDIIYVAEGIAPYDEGIVLKHGQALVGAAYGLENLRADFHREFDARVVAAVTGPGPIIRGTVTAVGDNLIAGCTVSTRQGAGVFAAPRGTLTIRNVWFRPSQGGTAVVINFAEGAVSIAGGGVIADSGGSGINISGGRAPVAIDRFPISGQAGTAVVIDNRSGGAVTFGGGSSIKLDGVARDSIAIVNCKGSIAFNDPIQIATQGGRGLSIVNSDSVTISGTPSRIATANAAAVGIRDSKVDIVLESTSAGSFPPAHLLEGVVLNKVRGRFCVTGDTSSARGSGGTIRDAQGYGVRVEQSEGIRIAHVNVIATSALPGKFKCPEDVDVKANVVCRAGLFVRHVRQSTFEDIMIDHAGQVGLNANNIGDITFRDVDVQHTESLPGVLLQEVIGAVTFDHCSVVDTAEESVKIEQRFNHGRVTFDRCTMAGAPHLLSAHTAELSSLELELKSPQLNDSRGSAVQISSGERSSVVLRISDGRAQRLGERLLELSARQSSHAAISMRDTFAVNSGSGAMISIVAGASPADAAEACVDLDGNHFQPVTSVPPVQLAVRSPNARLRLVGAPSAGVDAPPGTVTTVPSCN